MAYPDLIDPVIQGTQLISVLVEDGLLQLLVLKQDLQRQIWHGDTSTCICTDHQTRNGTRSMQLEDSGPKMYMFRLCAKQGVCGLKRVSVLQPI